MNTEWIEKPFYAGSVMTIREFLRRHPKINIYIKIII